jgi:hypothetical protein
MVMPVPSSNETHLEPELGEKKKNTIPLMIKDL